MSANSKNTVTVSVPAMSQTEIAARYRVLLENDKELAIAIAAQVLSSNAIKSNKVATPRNAPTQETELNRMLRCAHFEQVSERRAILSDLFARLGDTNKVVVTETELCESTGYRPSVLRRSLDIVSQRLNDFDSSYTRKYPEVLDIGYTILVEGDRAHAREITFARAVPKAPSKGKGKALVRSRANVRLASDKPSATIAEHLANIVPAKGDVS